MVPEAGFEPAHPFGRHPLKMVCLPSSTTPAQNSLIARTFLSGRRFLTPGWGSLRGNRLRLPSRGLSLSDGCRRLRGCLLLRRCSQLFHDALSGPPGEQDRKTQGGQHEEHRTDRRRLCQHRGSTANSKGSLARRPSKSRSQIAGLPGLQHDHCDEYGSGYQMDNQQQYEHILNTSLSGKRKANPDLPRRPAPRRYPVAPSALRYSPA